MVIAQMWDAGDHMGRGWWWVMGIGWLVVLATITVLALVLVRHFTPNVPARRGEKLKACSRRASREARSTKRSTAAAGTPSAGDTAAGADESRPQGVEPRPGNGPNARPEMCSIEIWTKCPRWSGAQDSRGRSRTRSSVV
jgi:hypothetical protein